MSKKSNKGKKAAAVKKQVTKKKEPIKKKPQAKKSTATSKTIANKKPETKQTKAIVKKSPETKKNISADKKINSKKTAQEQSSSPKPENKKSVTIPELTSNGSVSVRPLTEKPTLDRKGKVIQPTTAPVKMFKLRIDSRTIISVKSKEALKMWKDKYPNAVEEE